MPHKLMQGSHPSPLQPHPGMNLASNERIGREVPSRLSDPGQDDLLTELLLDPLRNPITASALLRVHRRETGASLSQSSGRGTSSRRLRARVWLGLLPAPCNRSDSSPAASAVRHRHCHEITGSMSRIWMPAWTYKAGWSRAETTRTAWTTRHTPSRLCAS